MLITANIGYTLVDYGTWISASNASSFCQDTISTELASFHSWDDISSFLTLAENHGLRYKPCWLGLVCFIPNCNSIQIIDIMKNKKQKTKNKTHY